MTAPNPSPAEQAVIDRFGIFEPEVRVVEEVARALAAESDDNAFSDGDDGGREDRSEDQDYYRRLAAAAVAAYRATQDGGAEEAVRRELLFAADMLDRGATSDTLRARAAALAPQAER